MWPEGTRSRDGRLKPLKKGFVHQAIATRLPVVPVVAHDAHLFWRGGTWDVRPGRLQIEILPAIDTSTWSTQTVDDHAAEVHAAFAAALGPDQQPLPKSD